MDKFTAEEKLGAVLRYLNGKEGYREMGKLSSADNTLIKSFLLH